MNTSTVGLWIAKQLDKLKMSSPIAFVFVQGILVVLASLFENGTIVVPTPDFLITIFSFLGIESINSFITGVLVIVIASLGLRTTKLLKK